MPVELEHAEVMVAMRIVLLGEIIELSNLLGQHLIGKFQLFEQVTHPSGHNSLPRNAGITLPESSVQLGYPLDSG
jgi:hypothetical protein